MIVIDVVTLAITIAAPRGARRARDTPVEPSLEPCFLSP